MDMSGVATPGSESARPLSKTTVALLGVCFVVIVAVTFCITLLLTNILERKIEAQHTFRWLVPVSEESTDPGEWGKSFPSEYDGYLRTAELTRTKYGGHGGSDVLPAEKIDRDPWLKRLFAGYAFSIDYRDRRGHAYMLRDQEQTRRLTERKQPGACLHCHSSVIPAYRFAGKGDVMKGFAELCKLPYADARRLRDEKGKSLISHPVSCVDCHDPATMQVRVTRPGFLVGIREFARSDQPAPHLTSIELWRKGDRSKPYDPNKEATRQEMRSFVCGQCHVEYYFKGDGKLVTYPWSKGLKVDQIESYYDQAGFSDWTHAETGAKVLKAQHPEFELWNQGIHARSGVACADCHMPYKREGALKLADHWIRSPLLNINRSCQVCHHLEEKEILARVEAIQDTNHDLVERAATALVDLLDAIRAAKTGGASEADLEPAMTLQRRAQWRLDFVAAENSMGFHAPQETARILAEAIDYFRQGQLHSQTLRKK